MFKKGAVIATVCSSLLFSTANATAPSELVDNFNLRIEDAIVDRTSWFIDKSTEDSFVGDLEGVSTNFTTYHGNVIQIDMAKDDNGDIQRAYIKINNPQKGDRYVVAVWMLESIQKQSLDNPHPIGQDSYNVFEVIRALDMAENGDMGIFKSYVLDRQIKISYPSDSSILIEVLPPTEKTD